MEPDPAPLEPLAQIVGADEGELDRLLSGQCRRRFSAGADDVSNPQAGDRIAEGAPKGVGPEAPLERRQEAARALEPALDVADEPRGAVGRRCRQRAPAVALA